MSRHRDTNSRERLLTPVKVMTAERKFWICDGLRRKTIGRLETIAAHQLSDEELRRWLEIFDRFGLDGLRKINRRKRAA